MLHIYEKIAIFMVSSTIGILCVFQGVVAQQNTTASKNVVSANGITIEELKTRRAEIEKFKDIDAGLKADSLKYLDGAIADLNLAAGADRENQELSLLIKNAPRRLESLRAEIKRPFTTPEAIENQAQQMDISTLDLQRSQQEAALAKEKAMLQNWNERLTAVKSSSILIAEKLQAAARRINEIQIELTTLTDSNEADIGNFERMLGLRAEQVKLKSESKLNELRKRSHNLLVELLGMERDVSQKTVEEHTIILSTWQAEVQRRRQQDAAEARQNAQEAIGLAQTLPKIIQDQFDINIQMSTELEEITREESDLNAQYRAYQEDLNVLEADFATARRRFELTELSEAMGLVMRKKRLNLPSARNFIEDSQAREARMSVINEKQIALDEMLRELSSPKALVQRLVGSVTFLSDVDRQSFDLKIQELITNRIEILEELKSGYNRIFKLLQDIEFTTQTIVSSAKNFGELLDRHLLWTRSTKRLATSDLMNLGPALNWYLGPDAWYQLFQDFYKSIRQHAIVWLLGFTIALTLVLARRRERGKINEINTRVQKQPLQDSIVLTFKVLGLTVLLAIVLPFLMAFPSLILLKLNQVQPHTLATSKGLLASALTLFILGFIYHICKKNGLAQAHFRWALSARKTLRQNLSWYIPIIVVFTFILAGMDAVPEIVHGETLARFALIIISAVDAIFVARILRFKGGITSVLIQKHPKSWLTRLRYIWYPLLIALPLLLLYLTVQGYYYSALEIERLTNFTIWLIFGLIVLNDLVLRLLMLSRRKIALEKARMARQLQQERSADSEAGSEPGTGDADASSFMESTVDMGTINEHTRTLLKTIIFILALAGLWNIWESVFPALGIFQNVELWSYTSVVDGVSQLRTITLADLAMAVVIFTITIIAVRNLPGLLEMILLNRLPLDPGARYAYAMVSRYTLTGLGIIVALNTLGIRWSGLQWLVAALGVGIGFGLQEIIANFICGLIILFERPVRVGDIVTIGTTDGVVTKIRIRATTIRSWDRKELLVPNKEFITGRLLNWSLSDQMNRILITVGVAYGSDVDKALALMREAAEEHEHVLSDPEPLVSFDLFGDNALTLTLRAYIPSIDFRVATTTDLNKAINQKFADAGIEISFPQRDVHLDAKRPLDVRVVSDSSAAKPSKKTSAPSGESEE